MDEFEKKYGFKEDEKIIAFHKSRRMFCIFENKLHIAEPNLPYSHAVWFEKEGFISRNNDDLFENIVRGIVDQKGDIYFYRGFDFKVDKETELGFFSHLKDLVEKLSIQSSAKIFGGMNKKSAGQLWSPQKAFGEVKDYL